MLHIEALPDFVAMARAKVNATLPANAVRDGIVVLNNLKFLDRPDLDVNFSLILRAFWGHVDGLTVFERAMRPDEEVNARLSTHQHVYFRVINTKDAELELVDVPITIYGFGGAVRTGDDGLPADQPEVAGQNLEFTITTESNVPLLCRWEDVG